MASRPFITPNIIGMAELNRQFENLGVNFPKSKIRQAANKGVNIPLRLARSKAPRGETKELYRGIIKVEEKKWKARKKLKKAVYQVYFNSAKNDIFQKPIDPSVLGSRGGQTKVAYAYYPFSMEYGFPRDPKPAFEGLFFVRDAIVESYDKSMQTVVDELSKSIDQLTR